jgi:hypothetical protein
VNGVAMVEVERVAAAGGPPGDVEVDGSVAGAAAVEVKVEVEGVAAASVGSGTPAAGPAWRSSKRSNSLKQRCSSCRPGCTSSISLILRWDFYNNL